MEMGIGSFGNIFNSFSICIGLVLVVPLYALRKYFAGGVCKSTARLDGKTVIITGANSGIGRETAIEMARRGARVILACRDVLKGEEVGAAIVDETGSKNLVIQSLDLASFDSIRKFVDRVKAQESRLDILINNAGVVACKEARTEDGFEMHIGTNHLGHFLLTNLLLDLLKKSAPSRVINVSSLAQFSGKIHFDNINMEGIYDRKKAYEQSKLANVLFTKELSRRLANTGVISMSLHPGIVFTNAFRHFPLAFRFVLWLVIGFMSKTCRQGAQTTIHCALLEPTPEMFEGKAYYFSDCAIKAPALQAENDEDSRHLWRLSEHLVGIN